MTGSNSLRLQHLLWPLVLLLLLALDPAHSRNWFQGLLGRFHPGRKSRSAADALASAGLRNLGNTCYLNSVLQGLYHVPEFRESLLARDFGKGEDDSAGRELQRVFQDLRGAAGAAGRAADTRGLLQSLGLDARVQEDAQELFLRLVNALDEAGAKGGGTGAAMSADAPSSGGSGGSGQAGATSPAALFRGETRQTIRCLDVAFSKHKLQRFLDLSVDVSRGESLESSLAALFSQAEPLEGYRAGNLGEQRAERSVQLAVLPRALCVHLKRFSFDAQTGRADKIGSRVTFPFALDMGRYAPPAQGQADAPQELKPGREASSAGPCVYDLAAVVIHDGTPTSGHYVCLARPDFIKRPSAWVKLDDSAVSTVSEEAVQREGFGEGEGWGGASRNAYMLFYVRR